METMAVPAWSCANVHNDADSNAAADSATQST
jgi:hypothetical protein